MTGTPPSPAPAVPSAASREAAERAWHNLRVLLHERSDKRREVSERLGLSFFRVKALRRLLAHGPLTLRGLADALLTDRPYATLVVDALERRGLVERTPNPADRRSKIVTLTAEGRATAEEAERILAAPPPAVLGLPPEDLAALDRIAAHLVETPDA
ncbi:MULTISPECIES: MarR family winged helix-turn-helix transcriptional regulator [Actinomadura]|uniref:MarR family winged helix-turn-helix transcriptional regulator n=1 Tax=Actinomadura yumaensis TaxID=111807 RepID=A0ABW2CHL2_9ACTN|nr:MarR family transcriptional regulator [Actinomadura sp. J1-007]MWK33023.1 MarR family transcriptional regulator [Actinomadura sp. J1-007]